jgi:hypothetical protein
MLRIGKQRETTSGNETVSGWARTRSLSSVVAASGGSIWREATSLEGALDGRRLVRQEASAGFPNRQVLV